MAVFERVREFGVMMALGTKPSRIALTIFTECALMTGVGIIIGNLIGGIIAYLNTRYPLDFSSEAEFFEEWGIDPRIYSVLTVENFFICSGIILVLALIMSIWPALKAARYKPAEALRYV